MRSYAAVSAVTSASCCATCLDSIAAVYSFPAAEESATAAPEPKVPRPPADAVIVGSLHYEPCCNLAPRPPRQRTAAECTVYSAQRCVRA